MTHRSAADRLSHISVLSDVSDVQDFLADDYVERYKPRTPPKPPAHAFLPSPGASVSTPADDGPVRLAPREPVGATDRAVARVDAAGRCVFANKGDRPAPDELERRRAEREDVGRGGFQAVGRRVGGGARRHRRARAQRGELDSTVSRDADRLRRDAAVDEARGVDRRQPGERLRGDVEQRRLVAREAARVADVAEAPAVQMLRHEDRRRPLGLDADDRADVGRLSDRRARVLGRHAQGLHVRGDRLDVH
mmetsp:Transcript_19933/g.62483  ORF Transcript_19933/g.62483 Transcript_19933/m.62483 type:complete len:250 (+) Transcript_19933:1398-2147(+)